MPRKPPLSKIKSGALSRGLAIAKVSLNLGTQAAVHSVTGLLRGKDDESERLKALLSSQMKILARELGQLKGSLMKVGQMLSMAGEQFLPPEANAVLKSLQNQSPPLEWAAIEKVLLSQLGPENLSRISIDPTPLAAASMGQVHRARAGGRQLAMKIQYPGVDQAIESDLKALRSMLTLAKVIPNSGESRARYDELFSEVRQMLRQEVDYARELEMTDEFRKLLAGDPRYIVPETFPEYSSKRVLTTSFEEGVPVDSPEVANLSQERRNALALAALDLLFREIFRLRSVQTDPHFGNYRVRLSNGGAGDALVLLDFGAVRRFPRRFIDPYRELVRGALDRNETRIVSGAIGIGFLREDDTAELNKTFADFCALVVEPFSGDEYDWGASDLPKRIARRAPELAMAMRLRTPPRELVFLDRKLGGMFIFVSKLGARIRARDVLLSNLGDI